MSTIDTTSLGIPTAGVMEAIEERFDSEDYTIRTIAIVVEVDAPTHGEFVVRCTDDRPWVLEAFLDEAAASVSRSRDALYEEQEGD